MPVTGQNYRSKHTQKWLEDKKICNNNLISLSIDQKLYNVISLYNVNIVVCQFGGGSLMIWGAFVNGIIFDLHIMNGNYDSVKYTDMLGDCLDPFMQPDWIFMQDNASIHRSKHTQKWLNDRKIQVLEWPANSPDLNPIENLWGVLTRAVYANERQFATKKELEAEILKQWDLIPEDALISLVKSLPNRIIDVISRKGSNIEY